MMKHTNKRLPILLLFALVLSLLPWAATPALALETPEQELETPAKPELETCTDKSITLKTVTPPEGCAVEYGVAYRSSDSPDEMRWQSEPTFTHDVYGNDLGDRYHFFRVRYRRGEEIGEVSDKKALRCAYLAPNTPDAPDGGNDVITYRNDYAVYDAEKGRMTASWDADSKTMTLDGFVGAHGQSLRLDSECTVLLKGENSFDYGSDYASLGINNGGNFVIRGLDEGARLAVRGMGIQANRLSIENCTVDVSWTTNNSNCYCAKIVNSGSATEIALTDAQLLCPAPPKPAPDENIGFSAFDMDSCYNSCSLALTRSTLRIAAPTAEDEALSTDCFYHNGKETNDPADISLLALTLKERSSVELNGRKTLFTRHGAIAVSADETSSAVFRGTVLVNTVCSIGGMSLGGNITIEAQENTAIKAAALNITAPGVTITSPQGYYFDAYTLAEGVVAVPSFSIDNDMGGRFLDADGNMLTGTLYFYNPAVPPTVALEGWTYGETAKTPVVSNVGNRAVTYAYKVKGAEDATYTTDVPVNAGEYTVRATIAETAISSGGTATADFTISVKTVASPTIEVATATYTGEEVRPAVTVKDGDTIIPESEYTVSYTNNTNVGTATVTITDKEGGNYTVSGSAMFTISDAPAIYTVTVNNDGHGTGTASPASGENGTVVTLSASADRGWQFKAWEVVSGGVTVTDNKFTIGSSNVVIRATFEQDSNPPTPDPTPTATPTPTSTVSDPSASENNADIPTVTPTPTTIPKSVTGDTISTKSISGLPKGTQTMDAGGSVNLKAVVTTADGANGSATWIAPVGHVLDAVPQEDGSLEIKAVGPGTAYVTAVSGSKTKTVKYNVKQTVKTLDASANAITLGVGEKYRLCITPDAPTTDKFYFESSDKNICIVDQKGLIKAKKTAGSATITIYAYDKSSEKKNRPVASVSVNVEEKEAAAVSVMDVSINYLGNKELYVGEMGYISTLINGGANNGGAAVKYTMNNKGIVKIDAYGHVTAKKAGTVTITATCGEKTDSITLTVKQPLKLYKVNKSYVKVPAPKEGKSSKKVTFTVRTNPTAKKFIDGGGKVSWSVTSKDTGITLKSDNGKGKAVFEVPSGASDTIVTATISDPASGKSYYTDCLIDVK